MASFLHITISRGVCTFEEFNPVSEFGILVWFLHNNIYNTYNKSKYRLEVKDSKCTYFPF